MKRTQKQIAILTLGFVSSLTFAGHLSAKSETVKMTITGSDLPKTIEITDKSILTRFNIWSGPGNFRVENGVKTPIINDGSILWSQAVVSDPPKGLQQYEVSFYGMFPEERIMYVLRYKYDPIATKGYVYLPGRGEPWYEVNVRSIYRGVEGHWFTASEEFNNTVEPIIRKAKVAAER